MKYDFYVNIKERRSLQLKKIKNKPSIKWLRIINAYLSYTKEEFADVMEINKMRNRIMTPKDFQGIEDDTCDRQYDLNKFKKDLNFLERNEHLFLENIKF